MLAVRAVPVSLQVYPGRRRPVIVNAVARANVNMCKVAVAENPTITLRCLSKDGSTAQTVSISAVKLLGACQNPDILDDLMMVDKPLDGVDVSDHNLVCNVEDDPDAWAVVCKYLEAPMEKGLVTWVSTFHVVAGWYSRG